MQNDERKHFLCTHPLLKFLSIKEYKCIFEIKVYSLVIY